MASAMVVAVPPVNVVMAPMPVASLVGVVMAARHVVVLMHPPVGMVAAGLDVVVLMHARVVVMLTSRDVVMFVNARVRVVTALGHVVMDVRAGARIVVALVRMSMDNRARRMRVMRLPRRPDTAHTGHTMNAGHPRDAGNFRCDVSTHPLTPCDVAFHKDSITPVASMSAITTFVAINQLTKRSSIGPASAPDARTLCNERVNGGPPKHVTTRTVRRTPAPTLSEYEHSTTRLRAERRRMLRELLRELLSPTAKSVGEAARSSLDNWGRTARLVFLLGCLMIVAAVAAVIYARYK